ncbi:hypothetical protein J6590_072851 [Homalodisca vitripennis]|nr:hypothetical protein J6590_072851 [Homalodisca vitripennis]
MDMNVPWRQAATYHTWEWGIHAPSKPEWHTSVQLPGDGPTLENGEVIVSIKGRSLALYDKAKILGVVVDQGLTFTEHVTHAL